MPHESTVPEQAATQISYEESLAVNLANWDERAPAHAASPGYGVAQFIADPGYISDVVRFDLPLLGRLDGQRVVHLQCHIGTDTISLARLGAASVTGLDFSSASLAQARELALKAGHDIDFVQASVLDAAEVLTPHGYDLVYTGIGALCWIPRIRDWAQVVAGLLAPGGRLFVREGHPMLWALDDTREDDLLTVDYPYFERPDPIVFTEPGTYVPTEATFQHNVTHSWNHGLGEIVTALLDVGLTVSGLVEHDSVPWPAVPGAMAADERGEYRFTDRPWRVPCSYTLQAQAPGAPSAETAGGGSAAGGSAAGNSTDDSIGIVAPR